METDNDNSRGQHRCLTPEEIAKFVLAFRKAVGWKQLTLALEAGVDERTVQRIERGEKVGEDTLRKIAKALRFADDAFVKPRCVPSEDDLRRETERALAQLKVIEAQDFSTLKDCEAVLPVHGHIVIDREMRDDMADLVAELKDLLTDWCDCYEDLSHTEKLEACRSLLSKVQQIEARGYRTLCGVYWTDDEFKVAVFLFVPKDGEPYRNIKQLIVQRRFSDMARESLRGQ